MDGQKVGEEITMPSEYKFCHLLEAEPFQLLCWNNEGQIDMIGQFDDDPIKHFGSHRKTIFEKTTRRLGWVQPDGFIILDLENNRIEQFAENGTQVGVFDIPQLDQVFRWGAEEILFIPSSLSESNLQKRKR